jgi:hypothetical protein
LGPHDPAAFPDLGQIKVKQGKHRLLLKEIVHAMNNYFRTSPVATNMIVCAFLVLMGVLVGLSAIGMSFFRNIF